MTNAILERSRARLAGNDDLADAIYILSCDRRPGRLTWAQAQALFEAYLDAQTALQVADVEAQGLRSDAAAQRALVEQLTNELDKHKQGDR